jgi:hypothetical protein
VAIAVGQDQRQHEATGGDSGRARHEPTAADHGSGATRPEQSAGLGDGRSSLDHCPGGLERVLPVDARQVEQVNFIPGLRHQVRLESAASAEEGHRHTFIS